MVSVIAVPAIAVTVIVEQADLFNSEKVIAKHLYLLSNCPT